MKKRFMFFLVWIFGLLCYMPSSAFSYYENKLYCRLAKDSVLISLNSKDGKLCNIYIRSLELAMKETYLDILAIQKYIDKKQDLGYRKWLKDEKAVYLNSLQSIRLNILSHMKSFEQALLQKSKDYFMQSISLYQKQLRAVLNKLNKQADSLSIAYVAQIKEQLWYIQSMSQAQSFEVFSLNLQKYLYLKKQLSWK